MLSFKKELIITLIKKKKDKEKTVLVNLYDYPQVVISKNACVDTILMGDFFGMTTLGYNSSLPATMNDMSRHSRIVARGEKKLFLIGDMPFLSHQVSNSEAIRNAALPFFIMTEFGHDLKLFDNDHRDTQNETA